MSRDVTRNDVTGSCITGSHRKWLYRKWRNGKCKGENFLCLFSHRIFAAFFLQKHLGIYSETFGHSIFPAEISTNENLGNSTNEMPQSLFQLANNGSPYRFNESVHTFFFRWSPFVRPIKFKRWPLFFLIWKSAFSVQLS